MIEAGTLVDYLFSVRVQRVSTTFKLKNKFGKQINREENEIMDQKHSGTLHQDDSEMLLDNENMDLSDLIKKTWNVYSVSTLFNCTLDNELKLKLYGKKMRESLALRLPKENCSYIAKFTVPERFDHPTEPNNPRPLMIVISSKTEDKEKEIYTGIMLSWGSQTTSTDMSNSVVLPLLLCRGTTSTIKHTHNILIQLFDCTILPMQFTTKEYHWISIMALQHFKDNSEDFIRMDYSIPGHPLKDEISTHYKIGDVLKIMKKIPDFKKTKLTRKAIDILMEILNYQVFINGGLHLDKFILRRIMLPNMAMFNNKFKSLNAQLLDELLTYFHTKSIKELYSAIAHVKFEE